MSRRCATLASVDLLLVTALLAEYGSTRYSWLAGPLSAAVIWALDCVPFRVRQPQGQQQPVLRGTAPTGWESSASRG